MINTYNQFVLCFRLADFVILISKAFPNPEYIKIQSLSKTYNTPSNIIHKMYKCVLKDTLSSSCIHELYDFFLSRREFYQLIFVYFLVTIVISTLRQIGC